MLRRIRRVYVAGPLASVLRARWVALVFAGAGFEVVSGWHDVVQPGEVDPDSAQERQRAAISCVVGAMAADLVFALCDCSEGTAPKGTLVELGIAIGRRVPIVWVQSDDPRGKTVFDALPTVRVVRSVAEGIDTVEALSRDRGFTTTTTECTT